MTNKEAIEELKKVDTLDMPARLCEAHYMSIKALEQELSGDAISRQVVLDGIKELKKSPWASDHRGYGFEYLITEAIEVVEELCVKRAPSVNTQEPKTGHWIRTTDEAEYLVWECDKCGWQQRYNTNFCPYCGARMESEEV